MRTLRALWSAGLAVAAMAPSAWADITEQEARTVVENATGVMLGDVEGRLRDASTRYREATEITFALTDAAGVKTTYRVESARGFLVGWDTWPSERASDGDVLLTADGALDLVVGAATLHLGELADELSWDVRPSLAPRLDERGGYRFAQGESIADGADIQGSLPGSDDPPVPPITGVVNATVAADGTLTRYIQYIPTEAEMARRPAEITADEALDTVRSEVRDTGRTDGVHARLCELVQVDGVPRWSIVLDDTVEHEEAALARGERDQPRLWFEVDAITGEVVHRDAASREGSRDLSPGPSASSAWPNAKSSLPIMLLGSAIAVCTVGAVICRRRNRRAGR